MWIVVNVALVGAAYYLDLLHRSTKFYVLLGAAAFIALGRQLYMLAPVELLSAAWVRIRTFMTELLATFLILGLLWRAGSWILRLVQ